MEGLELTCVDEPEDADLTVVGRGLQRFNIQQAGESGHKPLGIFLREPGGAVVGGLIGATYWDWLYVDMLWVRDDLRRRGHGRRVLERAELEARRRGARRAYLDTFSFQAPDFYLRQGYRVFGELQDFPRGHRRYFLEKSLQP